MEIVTTKRIILNEGEIVQAIMEWLSNNKKVEKIPDSGEVILECEDGETEDHGIFTAWFEYSKSIE